MAALRSTRNGLRSVRDHFMAIGVVVLAAILAIVLLAGCGTATMTATGIPSGAGASASASTSTPAPTGGLLTIGVDRLPEQARQTLALIARAGDPCRPDGAPRRPVRRGGDRRGLSRAHHTLEECSKPPPSPLCSTGLPRR